MVDFHSHILPFIDDGSDSLEKSLLMLEKLYAEGVAKVILTPHFYYYKDSLDEFLEKRDASKKLLDNAINKYKGVKDFPKLYLGAEVRYYDGISFGETLEYLKIQGTNLLLLEMPFEKWTDRMFEEIYNINKIHNIQVVLAHIERYLSYQNRFNFWKKIDKTEALIQSNAEFFISKDTRNKAIKLFRKGRIHVLGSDCHDLLHRPPNIMEANRIISSKCGYEYVKKIYNAGDCFVK